jgi:hypothetical protein
MQFDQLQHRIRTQLFGDDVKKINIEDHENLIEAYDKLKDKYGKLRKQADEVCRHANCPASLPNAP